MSPSFWNLSNHAVATSWSMDQITAAIRWGGVSRILREFPFPAVDPESDGEAIRAKAAALVTSMREQGARAGDPVMVMGEFTLVHALVMRLKAVGLVPLAATTVRKVEERLLPDGSLELQHSFRFVRFRTYCGEEGSVC